MTSLQTVCVLLFALEEVTDISAGGKRLERARL